MNMILEKDVVSLTDFARQTRKHTAELKKHNRPRVLTHNGKAAAVVLSSAAEVVLTAGAYVQVYTYQTSGAGLNAMNDTTDYFSLRFLGPT